MNTERSFKIQEVECLRKDLERYFPVQAEYSGQIIIFHPAALLCNGPLNQPAAGLSDWS